MENFIDNAFRQVLKEEFSAFKAEILSHFNPKNDNVKNLKTVFNFKEGCEYTNTSRSQMYQLTSKALIPHSKRGKKIFFEKEKLDKWLVENQIKTQQEIKEEAVANLKRRRN